MVNQLNLAVKHKLNKTWSLFTPTVSPSKRRNWPAAVWAFGIWLISRQQITVGVLTVHRLHRLAVLRSGWIRRAASCRSRKSGRRGLSGFWRPDHVTNVPEPTQPVKITAP
jgi:ATP-binding cassette subfamily B protein